MTFRIVDKNEATAKTVPKNIFKLSNYQNLYIKFSFCAIKSVVLGQSGSSVSRSIVVCSLVWIKFLMSELVQNSQGRINACSDLLDVRSFVRITPRIHKNCEKKVMYRIFLIILF